jgi:hypothetical protein
MTKLYIIQRDASGDFKVTLRRTGRAVYYGTARECAEWLEINGNDEWN